MLRKVTFYDETEAIQYQLKMRQLGYTAKMIRPEGKYEVIVAGEAPVWRVSPETPDAGKLDWRRKTA